MVLFYEVLDLHDCQSDSLDIKRPQCVSEFWSHSQNTEVNVMHNILNLHRVSYNWGVIQNLHRK